MAKDYKDDGKYKPMTISGEAFLSRFLLHVLPKGFVRIRYYGILSCRSKKEKITLCRNLIGCAKYLSELRGKTVAEKIRILYNRDIRKCPKCSGHLETYCVRGRYMLCWIQELNSAKPSVLKAYSACIKSVWMHFSSIQRCYWQRIYDTIQADGEGMKIHNYPDAT